MTTDDDDEARRNHSTLPAPGADDLSGQMAELQLAIAHAGEALAKVSTLLLQVRLAQNTLEHKTNVQRSKLVAGGRWLADHERRLRKLEGLDTAAE